MKTYKLLYPVMGIIVISLLCPYAAFGQYEWTTYSLLIKPGGKANAMGGAYTAVASDVWGTHYNPAGIGFIDGAAVGFFGRENVYGNYGPPSDYRYYSGVYKYSDKSAIGISYTGFDMNIADGLSMHLEKSFTLSYARQMSQNFSIGVNLKYIKLKITYSDPYSIGPESGTAKANSKAFEIGLLYKNIRTGWTYTGNYISNSNLRVLRPKNVSKGLSFGAAFQNMGTKVAYIVQSPGEPIPAKMSLGFAYTPIYLEDLFSVQISGDISKIMLRRNEDGTSDAFYKAVFTSWHDGKLDEKMYGIQADIFNLVAIQWGRSWSEINRDFNTFGVRLGPEFFNINYSKRKSIYKDNFAWGVDDESWVSVSVDYAGLRRAARGK